MWPFTKKTHKKPTKTVLVKYGTSFMRRAVMASGSSKIGCIELLGVGSGSEIDILLPGHKTILGYEWHPDQNWEDSDWSLVDSSNTKTVLVAFASEYKIAKVKPSHAFLGTISILENSDHDVLMPSGRTAKDRKWFPHTGWTEQELDKLGKLT